VNKDDMSDDAQFEAFLKGEDELSRLLHALPQPSPSAELDAVIMKRVKFAAAQQGRQAANDPGTAGGMPSLAPGLGRRWRIPAGIAATVLVGVFAHQAFDASNSEMALPQAETVAMVSLPRPAEPPAAMAPPPPPPEITVVQSQSQALPAPPPRVVAQAPSAPESVVEVRAERRPPAPVLESAAPVTVLTPEPLPSPPAPAPMADQALEKAAAKRAPANYSAGLAEERVTVSGSRIRLAGPEELLVRIENMLKAGQNKEALAAWAKFREAYPDHAVPKELDAQIKALQ
jgi:hypothetical protein